MKKLHVLIPSLVATASMPLVSLVGCDKPTQTYVVTLFAGEGTFGESNQIILSNIKPGAILRDVEGYKEPIDESFIGWLNNGSPFTDDQPISSNMLLTANYDVPSEKHIITLFAGEGVFSDTGTNVKKVTVVGNKTTLQTAIGSIVPHHTPEFDHWATTTGGVADMEQIITSDIELSARYKDPVIIYKAYAITTDDKVITLSNKVVVAKKDFATTVEYLAGEIKPENIAGVYVSGQAVTATITQGVDNHHVVIGLSSSLTTGDVAIVTKFPTPTDIFHSYICNKPEDWLVMVDNVIPDDDSNVGTFTATSKINNNWEIERVIVNSEEADVSNFELEVDTTDEKKATIKVLNDTPIDGDVLIWFKALTSHLEWETEDGLFDIPQAEEGTDQEIALAEFNEFVLKDKTNICKDYINSAPSIYPCDYTKLMFDVHSIDYSEEGVFNISLNFCAYFEQTFLTEKNTGEFNLQGKNLKAFVDSSSSYFTFECILYSLSLDEIRQFLIKDETWSINGSVRYPDMEQPMQIVYNSDYVESLDDQEWENEGGFISMIYAEMCLYHTIYFLQNITPE